MPVPSRTFVAALFLAFLAPLVAQPLPVTAIKLTTDPAGARVRPLESLVIQVLVYGEVLNGAGESQRVRLQRDGVRIELQDSQGGWLSKPFRYQGDEPEPFYEREGASLGAIILGRATGQFALQDSVLFTASHRTGSYEIEASLDGKTDRIKINVDNDAPSQRKPEIEPFRGERRASDPYRRLVEHYAPVVAQETWFQPKSDYLARFDFDGDWHGDNNWENTDFGSSQAYVYYAVIESETHWFLIYNFFHPRDYSDKCVAGTCHENDNEGMILTIQKDGSPLGSLQTMETLAHNNIYSYRADRRIDRNAHNIDGQVEVVDGSHPVVFIESGGHGVYGSDDNHSRYSVRSGDFQVGTGVTYTYRGSAERPEHPNARNVGYELVPIYEHWWLRSLDGRGRADRTFDDYYQYQPYGGRPGTPQPRIAGAFLGREFGTNNAKPFWGWHDQRTQKKNLVATGQWGLDPAYAVTQNMNFPAPFSLNYVYNPYLGIGKPPEPEPEPAGEAVSEFRPRRSNNYDPNARQGQFDIRMIVDHVVELWVQGDVIRYDALGGRPPKDDGSEYTQPIPRAAFQRFELEEKDGRGSIKLLERPTAQNDFTARIRIEDDKGGEDRYHARLRWEWTPVTSVGTPPVPVSQPSSTPASPARSRVISKHLGSLDGPPENEPPVAPPPPPGDELSSNENDPSRYDNRSEGLFEFRGRIDGTVRFRIQGDRVFAEALTGQPVEVERFSFSQPIPAGRLTDVSLERKDGRGEVVLLERPWEENGFTAVIQVSDPKGGDDRYHFRLMWRR